MVQFFATTLPLFISKVFLLSLANGFLIAVSAQVINEDPPILKEESAETGMDNTISIDCLTTGNTVGQTIEQMTLDKYTAYVSDALNYAANLPANIPIQFPLGQVCPFLLGISEETPISPESQNLSAIGYVDLAGNVQPITSSDLIMMFELNLASLNSGGLSLDNGIIDFNPLVEGVPTIDLVVFDLQESQVFLLPNIYFLSLYRDVLNSSVNRSVQVSDLDVDQLILPFHSPDSEQTIPEI